VTHRDQADETDDLTREDDVGRMDDLASRGSGAAPVGVRPAPSSPPDSSGRLRWVDPGPLTLGFGDRVAVRDADGSEWLGEVVIPPERLVEWPADLGRLPVVTRRASDAEWPSPPSTEGRRLLDALGLPPALLVRGGSPSELRARSTRASGGPREPAQDE
jgi:hypothetical protein